jgi:hypothetical protein
MPASRTVRDVVSHSVFVAARSALVIAISVANSAFALHPAIESPAAAGQDQTGSALYLLDSSRDKKPLGQTQDSLSATEISVPGSRSSVRFTAGSSFKFLVHPPEGGVPQFFQVDSEQDRRIVPIQSSGGKVAFARQRAHFAGFVHFDSAPADGGYLMLTPKELLRAGEYCIGFTKTTEAGCFALDPDPAAAAAAAASAAFLTEPAATNVVYYVDPAGNQIPLEYDVPFREGLSSNLVTRRDQ